MAVPVGADGTHVEKVLLRYVSVSFRALLEKQCMQGSNFGGFPLFNHLSRLKS